MAERIDYRLSPAEAAALLELAGTAFGRAGAIGGGIGGGAGGWVAGGIGGAAGGAAGGRAGVRFTRVASAEQVVDGPAPPDSADARVRQVIADLGRELPNPNGPADGSIWAAVPGGSLNLNVALVRIAVLALPSGGHRLWLRGSAREGRMGRKNTAANAIERVLAAM